MTSEQFQLSFIRQLTKNLPEHARAADTIAEKLDISVASAYRKLSAQSPFSLPEITKLCSEYLISLDEAMYSSPDQVVIFKKTDEVKDLDSLEKYFTATILQLQALRNMPDTRLYYAARDLPLFFYFRFPVLGAFKILVWLKEAGNDSFLKNGLFDFSMIPQEILKLGYDLNQAYYDMPTSEIWTPDTMTNIFDQIQYYYRSGLLSHESARDVLVDVSKIIDEREERARENEKKDNIRAELYSCDYLTMANGALAKIGPRRIAWVAFSGINFVHTANPIFCEEYERAFKQHSHHGVLISGSAEKQRADFFKKLRSKHRVLENMLDLAVKP